MGNTAVKETVTVGIFRTHAEAEAAIEQLRLGGFDLKRLSIAGKDYETREDVVGYFRMAGPYGIGDYRPDFGRFLIEESQLE